jgi:hypothetical protein
MIGPIVRLETLGIKDPEARSALPDGEILQDNLVLNCGDWLSYVNLNELLQKYHKLFDAVESNLFLRRQNFLNAYMIDEIVAPQIGSRRLDLTCLLECRRTKKHSCAARFFFNHLYGGANVLSK